MSFKGRALVSSTEDTFVYGVEGGGVLASFSGLGGVDGAISFT